MSKKRTFTREFKSEAVRLLTEEGYGTRQASESLGVSQNTLRTWRRRLEMRRITLFLVRARFRLATNRCGGSRKKTAACGWSETY